MPNIFAKALFIISIGIAYTAHGEWQSVSGQWDAPKTIVMQATVTNGYALVNQDNAGVQVLDLQDPTHPLRVGEFRTLSKSKPVISGRFAYSVERGTSDESFGLVNDLVVWDVADLRHPVLMSQTMLKDNLSGESTLLWTFGNALYLSDYKTIIFDITDKRHPVVVTNIPHTSFGGEVTGVRVKGAFAYLSAQNGVFIFDLSDPFKPRQAAFYPYSEIGNVLDIEGSFLYVLKPTNGITILDASNPTNLVKVGYFPTGSGGNLKARDPYLYVINTRFDVSLSVIDIRDKANPVLVGTSPSLDVAVIHNGSWGTMPHRSDLGLQGGYAFAACGTLGLVTFDISNPSNPAVAGQYPDTIAYTVCLRADEDHLYSGDIFTGIRLFNIDDPTNLVQVGICPNIRFNATDTIYGFYSFAAAGNYLYAPENHYDFPIQVLNMSDPGNIVQETLTELDMTPSAAEGSLLVAQKPFQLYFLDIHNPTNPVLRGQLPYGYETDVAILNGYVYVTDYAKFYILDARKPASPTLAGRVKLSNVSAFAVNWPYAYVASFPEPTGNGTDSKLHVIDIRNPANPVLAASCAVPLGRSHSVAVSGQYVLIAGGGRYGVQVVNVANPLKPRYVGRCQTPGSARAVLSRGNQVYVADGAWGVTVLENRPSRGKIQWTTNTCQIVENGGSLILTAIRTGGSYGPVAASYGTVGESAEEGSDFDGTNGWLTWNNGDTGPKSVVIPIIDDIRYEGVEKFSVRLNGDIIGPISIAAVTLLENDPAIPLVSINCGGSAKGSWSADSGCLMGTSYSANVPITKARNAPERVYQSCREGPTVKFKYNIPDGIYQVRLHFAELRALNVGQRVFSISFNGVTVLKQLDVVSSSGGARRAMSRSFKLDVGGGKGLTITGKGLNGAQAFVNGIEIIPLDN